MRIAIVDTVYSRFLDAHFGDGPGAAGGPYEEQWDTLMRRRLGTGSAYSRGFAAAGHDAHEFIVNAEPLQRAWASEHGMRTPRSLAPLLDRVRRQRFLHRVAGEQLERFAPDVVYVQDVRFLSAREVRDQRERGRLVVAQIASPLDSLEVLRPYDLVVTSFPHWVTRLRALGLTAEYLRIGFDTAVLDDLHAMGIHAEAGAPRDHSLVFVGGLGGPHAKGTAMLERLCELGLPLEVWGYGAESLAGDSPLRERHHGEAWGLEMLEVLARSRLVVNRHIDVAEGYANNMRLFESTGVGATLLTEAAPNLAELFEPGHEVVPYESNEALAAHVERLLVDERQRVAIGARGQARTLADHTYDEVVADLAEILARHRR